MDYLLTNSSGCSSGCESGWTSYLDNSCVSPYASYNGNGVVGGKFGFSKEKGTKNVEEEEEDLSMVSDASSGPPHFVEEEDYVNDSNSCYYNASVHAAALSKNTAKINKTKENRHRNKVHEQPPSLLDDTASSPLFGISNNNFTIDNNNHESAENVLDFSQGYSTTHFEERSAYQEQYGFFHSSLSGNYLQKNQLSFDFLHLKTTKLQTFTNQT